MFAQQKMYPGKCIAVRCTAVKLVWELMSDGSLSGTSKLPCLMVTLRP